jgi:uncharacterized phage protein (TIGR01671 family)
MKELFHITEGKEMMLKFRAWMIKERKMVNVIDLLLSGGGIIQTSCEDSNYDGLSKVVGRDCYLMQSIGREDQNGKEVYEGDIVKGGMFGLFGVVTFKDDRFAIVEPDGMTVCYEHTNFEFLEVVGNIYENPELLVR